MSLPHPSAFEQRLIEDAAELPGAPEGLHARILQAITDEDSGPDDLEAVPHQGRTGPPWLALAAGLALILSVYALLNQKPPEPELAVVSEPVSVAMAELEAYVPPAAVAVGEVSGTMKEVFESPYQTELNNIERDVQSATRFLLGQFGASIPSPRG